jgi:hypothetical protein
MIAFIPLLAILLTACSNLTSGMMRVDVEVYKGPLSEEPDIQIQELVGYLEESRRSMAQVTNFALAAVAIEGLGERTSHSISKNLTPILNPNLSRAPDCNGDKYCLGSLFLNVPIAMKDSFSETDPRDMRLCDDRQPYWHIFRPFDTTRDFLECIILRGLYVDGIDLIRKVNEVLSENGNSLHQDSLDTEKTRKALRHIAELSGEFRSKAFRWGVSMAAGTPPSLPTKMAVINFVVAASEYANQLQVRADTLMKQIGKSAKDRRELSLSQHLKDSAPTDFVRLYDWYDASLDGSADTGVKAVERIFNDRFWTKINTVYASGQGKVRMAFVKDQLGNWNLKDFSNSPGELLEAYGETGKALADRARDIAANLDPNSKALATTLSAINTLVQGSKDVIEHGKRTDSKSVTGIIALDTVLNERLNTYLDRREKEDLALRTKYEDVKKAADVPTTPTLNNQATLEAKASLMAYRKSTLDGIERILNENKQQFDELVTIYAQ